MTGARNRIATRHRSATREQLHAQADRFETMAGNADDHTLWGYPGKYIVPKRDRLLKLAEHARLMASPATRAGASR